jgi:tetratricopeptide (TPR) repeat protein
MSNPNIDETAPHSVAPVTPAEEPKTARKPRRWLWVLLGLLVLLIATASGSYAGYRSALTERLEKEYENISQITMSQFQMGVIDLESGRYEAARDRFEYVIELDPSFPGAADKLAEAMLAMAIVNTNTPAPTPTIEISPTPDLRGAEELFTQSVQHLRDKEWNLAIETLDRLRQEDLAYRTLDVDGMYYIALRYRGVQKIIYEGNLEGGMYDLSLTETFGPLDHEANGFRNWARMYVSGASFWEVDWERVLAFFGQIYAALPNLRDGSNWTAIERFRLASIAYADEFVAAEMYCEAIEHYTNALAISDDPTVGPKLDAANIGCHPPSPTSAPVPNTPTPDPAEITPTTEPGEVTPDPDEPTPEPTALPEGG